MTHHPPDSSGSSASAGSARGAAVDVVLPCLNEAGALPWVLSRMPAGYRAIVADNGSSDGSGEIAVEYGATLVRVAGGGFGAACATGLEATGSDLVCIMDADASLDPADLPEVAEPVRHGRADLVLGRRRPTERGAWPAHARAANGVLAWRLRRRTGYPLHDLGPMRAAGREGLLSLQLADRQFGYPLEMLTAAAARGWRVREVDVGYHPRVGVSKVTGTVRGTLRAIRDMRRVLAAGPPGRSTGWPSRGPGG